MRRTCVILALVGMILASGGLTRAADETKVEFQLHSGYFESNKSGLKGDSSYLVITDQKVFDQTFGKAVVMGAKPNFLPNNAFESRMVVAAIKRGKSVYQYKVEKVTAKDGVLTVEYTATGKEGGGTATFASPMIVSVEKGKYTSVVFMENGKKVDTVKIDK